MYVGTASGSAARTANPRAAGRSVRVTRNAEPTPSTTQPAVTTTASATLRVARAATRAANGAAGTAAPPASAVRTPRYTSGSSPTATGALARASSPGRGAKRRTARRHAATAGTGAG